MKYQPFIDPWTSSASKRARLYAAIRKVRVNKWIKQSGYDISSIEKIKIFDRISRKNHEQAIDLAIQSLAFIEGIMRANDTLQIRMGMSQVRYNVADSVKQTDSILRIMIMQELLKISNLPQKIKDEVLFRITARILPLRDITNFDLHDHFEPLTTAKTNGKIQPQSRPRLRESRDLPLARGDVKYF